MRKSMSNSNSRRARAGVVVGSVAAVLLANAAPVAAAAVPLTLSSASGPSGGGNSITVTAPSAVFNTTAPAVSFQYKASSGTTCTPAWTAGVAKANANTAPYAQAVGTILATVVKRVSTSKLAVTVPAGVALIANGASPPVTPTSASYLVCVYPSATPTTALLIGSATYNLVTQATITNVEPNSGPAVGGTTIIVSGTNLPTSGMTATIDGLPLAVVTGSQTATGFTAVTPAHVAATGLNLAVTAGGVTTTATTAATLFSYTNGIIVTPNTASNTKTTSTDIDIQGVGFSSMDFSTSDGTTPDDANAHVYLVNGAYDPADGGGGAKTLPEIAECTDTVVISNTEIVCSLNLYSSLDTAGATTTTTRTVVAADAVTTSGSTTMTSATAAFANSDIGSLVVSPNVPTGTTVVSRTNATTVVLSAAATASGTGQALTLEDTTPVPNDTYTLTVVNNGLLDADTVAVNPVYTHTTISSGSTFTVADY